MGPHSSRALMRKAPPLLWKRLEFRVAGLALQNSGPVSKRGSKNFVFNYYFSRPPQKRNNNNNIIVHVVCRRIIVFFACFRSSQARSSNSSKGIRRENIWRTDYRLSFRRFIRLAFPSTTTLCSRASFSIYILPLKVRRVFTSPL